MVFVKNKIVSSNYVNDFSIGTEIVINFYANLLDLFLKIYKIYIYI